MQAGRKWK